MTPTISPELQAEINKEGAALAVEWHYYPHSEEHRDIVGAYEAGGVKYAARVEDLERRRNEANALLFPLLDYGQSKEANIPWGASITTVILQRATRFEQAKKALEDLLSCHIKMRVIGLSNKINAAKTLLASWKEEGKEVDNG